MSNTLVNATILTPSQARRDVAISIMTNRNTIVTGPVGVGKTDVVRQAANDCGIDAGHIIDRRLSQMSPIDVTLPFPNQATGRIDNFVPDWLPRVDRDGERGVILFDEYTNASIGMQAAIDQLILEGELPNYRKPAGWVIIGTGNRMADRAAAGKFSLATSNRLRVLHMGPHIASWLSWAEAIGLAAELVAFIRWCDREGKGLDYMHKLPPAGGDAIAFPTPRSIAALHCLFDPMLGLNDVELQRNIAHGVGDDWAAAFMAFLKSYRLAPSRDLILADPHGAPIPREPQVMYSLVVGLSAIASPANVATLAAYAGRLDPAYKAAFWSSAIARHAELKATKEYVAHKLAQGDE